MNYSNLILLLAVFYVGCESPYQFPEAKACHELQEKLNSPYILAPCADFADYIIPKLKASGATNIRRVFLSIAGKSQLHEVIFFNAEGEEWVTDNRRLAKALGKDIQEKVDFFINPFHDVEANVTVITYK